MGESFNAESDWFKISVWKFKKLIFNVIAIDVIQPNLLVKFTSEETLF